MKTFNIIAKKREEIANGSNNVLRRMGVVPCNLYGEKLNENICVFINDIKDAVFTPDTFKIKIDLNGKSYDAVIQEVQLNPLSDEIIHVDFMQVSENKVIKTQLPLRFIGQAAGIKDGGRFLAKIRKLNVKGILKDLPDYLDIDISNMEVGKSIKVKDLEIKNIEVLNSPTNPVCTVSIPRSLKAKGILDPADVAALEAEEAAEGVEGAETTEGTADAAAPAEGGAQDTGAENKSGE